MANKIKKIAVDHKVCIGCGTCVGICSTVFELNEKNKSCLIQKGGIKNAGPADRTNLIDQTVTDETLNSAVDSCPVRAISVE